MTELTHTVHSPAEISTAATKLRQAVLDAEISPNEVMTVLILGEELRTSANLTICPGSFSFGCG